MPDVRERVAATDTGGGIAARVVRGLLAPVLVQHTGPPKPIAEGAPPLVEARSGTGTDLVGRESPVPVESEPAQHAT